MITKIVTRTLADILNILKGPAVPLVYSALLYRFLAREGKARLALRSVKQLPG